MASDGEPFTLPTLPHSTLERQLTKSTEFLKSEQFSLICGGQVIEDIDNYNRTTKMFHIMQAENKRLNYAIEGFGGTSNWDTSKYCVR